MVKAAQDVLEFVVARDALRQTDLVRKPLPRATSLADGAILTRVDRFAFTANNITYAKLGDAMKYWQLFPAPDGFGNIPVWGFGEVIVSKHPDVREGEMLFGYFPMATHLVIEAGDVTKRGLRDASAHRQGVAPVYNAYARVSGDETFRDRQGDHQALLRPLFMLSFLVDDFLVGEDFFGAKRVILSSASSKTAFGLAHLLQTQRRPMEILGLTSAANADFVRSLGCYDRVVTYDNIESLPAEPTAYVDMAGNSALRTRLHHHLGDALVYSGRVGLTHHDRAESADESDLPGARPTWFFAPDQIRKRSKDWGPGGLETRFKEAWFGLGLRLDNWLEVTHSDGPDAVRRIYLETLDGKISPRQGHMLSLAG